MALNSITVVAVLLAGLMLAATGWAFFRYYQCRVLSDNPAKATGRLIKKSGRRQWSLLVQITNVPVVYWVEYEFKDSRGKAYRGKSNVQREVFDNIQPSAGFEIVYVHDKPEWNCLAASLEQEAFKHLMLGLIGAVASGLMLVLVV